MILDHVADGARLIVKGAAALDAEVFRHGDLHALDMVAVPERLQERIGEAEEEHVMHRPLPQVMVDAEDRRLVEGAEQDLVELLRRGEVVPKGFSTMTRAPLVQPALASCSTTGPNSAGGMAR